MFDTFTVLMIFVIILTVILSSFGMFSIAYLVYLNIKEKQEKERNVFVNEKTLRSRKTLKKLSYVGIIIFIIINVLGRILNILSAFI